MRNTELKNVLIPFVRVIKGWQISINCNDDGVTLHTFVNGQVGYLFFIRLEARLQPNIGFNFESSLTVFTRSDINPLNVNRFEGNLEHSEYTLCGWPWQILRSVQWQELESQAKFLHQVSNTRFYRFSIDQISRNLNTTIRSVWRWILSQQNLENFPVRGNFSKNAKNDLCFQCFATLGHHNSAVVIDRRKFVTKWSFYGLASIHFTDGINSNSFPGLYTPYNKPPNFLRYRTARQITLSTVSRRQPVTIDYWVT